MKPFHDPRPTRLEAALRAGARDFGPQPPPGLRARILADLRAEPALPAPIPVAPRERLGAWVAAAAALLVLGGAWWLTRLAAPRVEGTPSLVRLTRDVLGAGKGLLDLPQGVETNLRAEAEKLLADTTRAAQGVVRGLPAPLRARLEQM
ncbi:MAG TPA: hypothetical protein VF530_19220 [Planctomycetota bacterium]